MSVSNVSPIRHVCLSPKGHGGFRWISDGACLVSDGSPMEHDEVSVGFLIRHVGVQSGMLVSDQACRSPIRHVGLRSGMSVSDKACQSPISHVGLRSGMSVSDQACRSPIRHVGLRSGMSVSD